MIFCLVLLSLFNQPQCDQNVSRKETILEDIENVNKYVHEYIKNTKTELGEKESTTNAIDKDYYSDSRSKTQDDKTGSSILLEDSGIHMSFHDDKASVDYDQSVNIKCLDSGSGTYKIDQNGSTKKIVADLIHSGVSDGFDIETETELSDMLTVSHVDKNVERSKHFVLFSKNELSDPNYMSCASLLKPLESELEESFDILPETDISLNESLDVNEILSVAESPGDLFSPEVNRSTTIPMTKEPQDIGLRQFKHSFELLPKIAQKILDVTKVTTHSASTEMALGDSLHKDNSLPLCDHSYSKVRKYVKFQIKSSHSKRAQPLTSSTPRPADLPQAFHAKSLPFSKCTKLKVYQTVLVTKFKHYLVFFTALY